MPSLIFHVELSCSGRTSSIFMNYLLLTQLETSNITSYTSNHYVNYHYELRESHFIFMKNNTKAPTKQSQHINATYCNTVRHNMLHMSGDPVPDHLQTWGNNTPHVTTIATCWVLPGDWTCIRKRSQISAPKVICNLSFLQAQNPPSWLENPLALRNWTLFAHQTHSLHIDYLFLNIAWSCLKNLPYEQLISTQYEQFPGKT